MKLNILVTTLSLLMLSACGGSSSSSEETPPPTLPPAEGENQVVTSSDNFLSGSSAELVLYFPNDQLSNIKWQQVSGEAVTLLSDTSKVIAFTPTTAGDYEFSVTFTSAGNTQTLNKVITVEQEQSPLTVRLGHAVLEGNKVSLRSHLVDSNSQASLTWQQVSGPSVSFTDNDLNTDLAVFFDAPQVSKDTILHFQATIEVNGQSYSDDVIILVEDAATISSSVAFTDRLATVFPFDSSSPYKDVLKDCVYSNTLTTNSTCRLNQLPLIAHDSSSPTVDQIMQRVVVSHEWMGVRFKEFLTNNDPHNDFKNLLRATTAIVISYDVRPSFYWAATGAIYLDANYLWLTPQERDTINEAPDYRAAFGSDLQFEMPWRYVKDNDYASPSNPVQLRESRTAQDALFRLASLMYHELAHANDYFPSTVWQNINRNDPILVAANSIINNQGIQSDKLQASYPLKGNEMYRLASVRFGGNDATTIEKSYLPEDVANFFSIEQAPQFYSYSSDREDFAILFDGFMMQARYGVSRDVAVSNKPTEPPIYSTDYIVNWGQRGRIGDPQIKPRVAFVAERILPEFTDAQQVIDGLPAPIMMEPGKNWIENLTISPSNQPTSLATEMLNQSKLKAASKRAVQLIPEHL